MRFIQYPLQMFDKARMPKDVAKGGSSGWGAVLSVLK